MSATHLQLRSNTTAFKQKLTAALRENSVSKEHLKKSKTKYALRDLRKQMAELATQTRQKHLKEAGLIVLKYKNYFVQAMKQERDNYDKKLFRIIRDTSLSPAQRNEKKRQLGEKLDGFLLDKYVEANNIKMFEEFKSVTGLDYLEEIREKMNKLLLKAVPSRAMGKKSKRGKKANKKTVKKGKNKVTKKRAYK